MSDLSQMYGNKYLPVFNMSDGSAKIPTIGCNDFELWGMNFINQGAAFWSSVDGLNGTFNSAAEYIANDEGTEVYAMGLEDSLHYTKQSGEQPNRDAIIEIIGDLTNAGYNVGEITCYNLLHIDSPGYSEANENWVTIDPSLIIANWPL